MTPSLPADHRLVEKAWEEFIEKLREAGDGNYNDVKELQALCLRAHYDMEDLYAQLMTARDCLNAIKAGAVEGLEAVSSALECKP